MNSQYIERIYTDGGCINNPGPGGWGVVAQFQDGSVVELGDRTDNTTNNRMELQAAIQAAILYQKQHQTEPIKLLTDSKYVIDGITKWIKGWQKKGWKTAAGKPVLNQDLWKQLHQLNHPSIHWCHVKGHSGEPGNERADAIANSFARGQTPHLKAPKNKASGDSFVGGSPKLNVQIRERPANTNSLAPPDTMKESPNFPPEDTIPAAHDRIQRLSALIESLRIADEIADMGYFISSSDLADLMGVNASAVTSRGHEWTWRNWIVSRVKREGNQILWQLDRLLEDDEPAS